MNKSILSVALFLVLTLTISSCKKYEDGPTFSLKFRKARVADDWVVEECMATSSSGTVTDRTVAAQNRFPQIEMLQDGTMYFYDDLHGSIYETAHWEFGLADESVLIHFDNAPSWTWEITRLKEDELWIIDIDNLSSNEQLKIKFKAISHH